MRQALHTEIAHDALNTAISPAEAERLNPLTFSKEDHLFLLRLDEP